jgi:hypothetical protein
MTAPRFPGPPDDLKTRGRELWAEVNAGTLPAPTRMLVHEAGRLLDRLDRLHALLAGREDFWVQVFQGEEGEVTLVVDKILAEARQYTLAYNQLFEKMRQAGVFGKGEEKPTGGGLFDELGKKRAERQATG